jgi:hypothetical protein
MQAMTDQRSRGASDDDARQVSAMPLAAGPRDIAIACGRMGLAVGGLLLAYFMVPLNGGDNVVFGVSAVVLGLVVFAAIFVRQMRRIRVARHPVLRAAEAIALVATLFVVTVASIHYGFSEADAANYSESLDRLDALYFTVTTLATVGFGDITPTATVTRSVTTVQMVLGVALLGAGVRVLLGVAQFVADQRRAS